MEQHSVSTSLTAPDCFPRMPLVAAACVMALLAAVTHGCGIGNKLTMIVEEFPRASSCRHCHIEIFDEWSKSSHATAYSSPQFREATDDYRFVECLGCHTPVPTLTSGPPPARTVDREEGVTCVSCHLEEGRLSGPLDPTGMVSPHPIEVSSDRYRDSRFCGRCHEGTYSEWSDVAMEDKLTCQQCHMPQRRGKVTQATSALSQVLVAFEDNVLQRGHGFATIPTGLDTPPCSLEVTRGASAVTLKVTNHLPHSLPPGDFGMRIIVLTVAAVDMRGNSIPLGERELVGELGSAIPPRSSLAWELAIPPDVSALRIQMLRSSYEGVDAHALIATEIILP